ncbi:uncharacterized protein N7484_006997 [Penicillium longicatenatum]|uniref:uncharacterized protein n=1 Tax=Penicillium longicatenatum TaxID=1561947 RepID=UPI002547C374|nr:uncharacterized protein N7484_006997 [Penicillium longicatenatum]KAJ5639135.1 hypothetical protein N7484_006997 [Penicillium longicatenatum]
MPEKLAQGPGDPSGYPSPFDTASAGPPNPPQNENPRLSPGNSLKVNLGLQSEWAAFDRVDWVGIDKAVAEARKGRQLAKRGSSQHVSDQASKKQKCNPCSAGSNPLSSSPLQNSSAAQPPVAFPAASPVEPLHIQPMPFMMTRFLYENEGIKLEEGYDLSLHKFISFEVANSGINDEMSNSTSSQGTESDPEFRSPLKPRQKSNQDGDERTETDINLRNDEDDGSGPEDYGNEDTEHNNDGNKSSLCEFSRPCHMGPSPDGMHFRKVVSHFFGRNKASTKLFPDAVWVHYCRKHYQRARYRADQWPFTQCELLLESLSRMEQWDGVENFEITLRRREILRVEEEEQPTSSTPAGPSRAGPSRARTSNQRKTSARARKKPSTARNLTVRGRKLPRAITAPVPEWLRNCVGRGKTFAEIRGIVNKTYEYMIEMREAEKALEESLGISTGDNTASAGKKSPWLPARSSSKDIERQQGSRARFPDIEILPTFKPWVLDAALRQREQAGIKASARHGESNKREDSEVEASVASLDGTESVGSNEDEHGQEIGRTGLNRGNSAGQRRRNDKSYMAMVTRVTPRGSVKKPSDAKGKGRGRR